MRGLRAVGLGDFVMADVAVEFREHGHGLIGHDGSIDVWSSESANEFKRTPGRFNEDFDFVAGVPHEERRPQSL
jgi:hypothetical protein